MNPNEIKPVQDLVEIILSDPEGVESVAVQTDSCETGQQHHPKKITPVTGLGQPVFWPSWLLIALSGLIAFRLIPFGLKLTNISLFATKNPSQYN